MKDNLTELVFILDRSGSMESMSKEAIGGFNAFLEEQKKVEGDANLTLVLFDNEYLLIHNGKNVKECECLDDKTYVPRGTTALLDAIGRTIDDVGRRLAATPEAERPGKVLVAIMTDGQENASKDYKKAKINEMISHQTGKYAWQFLFLAANQDAMAEGMSLGIARDFSMTYDSHQIGATKSAFASVACSATAYRSTGKISGIKQQPIDDVDTDIKPATSTTDDTTSN